MPHFQKTTEEMASFHTVPVYLVVELVFHARMLDLSAALLTFTSQGIPAAPVAPDQLHGQH